MEWIKGLFSSSTTTPEKNKQVVEMNGSPEEEQRVRQEQMRENFKDLEEDIKKFKEGSIERLKKEIEYNKLSYQLNPGVISEKVYQSEMTRLNRLLSQKMNEQTQKDWNGGDGKRTKSKKAKASSKSKKLKRSAKPRSRK